MQKIIIAILILFIGGSVGYFIFDTMHPEFDALSPEEMHERIIEERDYAIAKAVMAGDFKCCIHPPCTMCYMEANQWNNYKAGTCACDEFIARGEEPCPQCKNGLITDTGISCEFSETCESQIDTN